MEGAIRSRDPHAGGGLMLTRRSFLDRLGFAFDPRYFLTFEDIDLCREAKRLGYKVMYYPGAVITHYKYGSAQSVPFRTIKIAHKAMKIFYRKHYAPQHSWLFNQFVYLGINLRLYSVRVVNLLRKNKSVH